MQTERLPSWRDTTTRQAILGFVSAVADAADPHYVPPAGRVAVFDILLRKFAAQAERDPALRERQPWQAAYHKDYAAEREFADTAGAERAMEAARAEGWTVVSMRDDWRQVFPDVADG